MLTVGAVCVVTRSSLFEGFECNDRLVSPLSVLVRCDRCSSDSQAEPIRSLLHLTRI